MVKNIVRIISLLGVSFLISGCVMSRSEIQIQKELQEVSNPTNSTHKVFIGNVVDNRKFEIKPSKPFTPSLAHAKDLTSKSVTSSVIGRKRGGFGNAGGNIVLPKGRTVELSVRRIVENSFKKKGYNIVRKPGRGIAQVDISIEKFWFWLAPGFWSIALNAEADIIMSTSSNILISSPIHVKGATQLHTQMGMDRKYANTIQKALEKLDTQIQKVIK